jgi:hypothetical protein
MHRIPFTRDPAWITVGEGIRLGFGHWAATIGWWVLPALAVGGATAIMSSFVFGALDAIAPEQYITPTYDVDWAAFFRALLPQFLAQTLVVAVVAVLARWMYLAIAIGGIRGTALDAGWVTRRGVRSLAVDLAVTVVLAGVAGLIVGSAVAGLSILVLAGIAALVVAVWIQVRLAFWSVAIFDGHGVLDGLRVSWSLSEGAVTRMVGWALAMGGVAIGFRFATGIVLLPLGDGNALRSGIDGAVTEAFTAFQLILLTILYASQTRLRAPERLAPPPAPQPLPVPAWGQPAGVGDVPLPPAPGGSAGVSAPPPPPSSASTAPRDHWRG